MIYQHFTYKEHGFTGHLVRPNVKSSKAVLIFAGGEKSLLPGIQIAEAFADYGIIGMAVSLFGASGLPKGPDRHQAFAHLFLKAVLLRREALPQPSVQAVQPAKIDFAVIVIPEHQHRNPGVPGCHAIGARLRGRPFLSNMKEENSNASNI